MAAKKITRHNHPLMVNARRESYNAGRADGYKEGIEKGKKDAIKACDRTVENLHKYYRSIIDALSKRKNNQFERINLSYDESDDMHFVSSITISYRHSGNFHQKELRFEPGHRFFKGQLVDGFNELLRQMIADHEKEASDG